ncbi:aminotransferase class IV [Fimbriiglobus ruber]|uniref:branched-chain-amino-acid transaminase n=1 Tax=Fimbriiglobus ruber TaxID=1908690 RepID=A0A225DAU4_9BACT|nr:aminotransferase class IV [Fimbriiglobus ruber]OWK38582.1 Aminodeoxychorismate lyase [Fimbriiglobus ruber]
MAPQQPAPTDDFAWANPQLRLQLLTDPAAVLKDRGLNVPPDMPLPVMHEFVRMAYLLWVDGKIIPIDQFSIDPADEGLLFGRGVWESTRTVGGQPWLWQSHVERVKQSAPVLYIDLAPERIPDAKQVHDYVRALTTQDVVLRLNVTAGRPGKPGLVWMSAAPLPYPVPSLKLRSHVNPVQKGQPYLTLKTFQYATRLRIGQQAMKEGYHTALMVDTEGNLLEASHANLFLRLSDGWVTPTADGGLLPGTVRHILLQRSPLPIREQKVPHTLLGEVREVFVTNSNVGIIPVTQIDGLAYPIGPETTQLMNWLNPKTPGGVQYRFVDSGTTSR